MPCFSYRVQMTQLREPDHGRPKKMDGCVFIRTWVKQSDQQRESSSDLKPRCPALEGAEKRSKLSGILFKELAPVYAD